MVMVNFVWMIAYVTHAGPPLYDLLSLHPAVWDHQSYLLRYGSITLSPEDRASCPTSREGALRWMRPRHARRIRDKAAVDDPLTLYSAALTRSMLDQGRNS
jgi:hypothetical protein